MEDARESARVLSALPVSMVKLHSLYIPKECALYKEYEAGNIQICSDVYKRQFLGILIRGRRLLQVAMLLY